MLLGVKRSTNTLCLLRETGQLPLYFYWFCCVARLWNSLLTSNNALLSKINEADSRLTHRKGSWAFEVLFALYRLPWADVHISDHVPFQNQHEWLWTATAWPNDSRLERPGPDSSTWCTCFVLLSVN